MELVQTSLAGGPAEVILTKNLLPLETICGDINRILSPTKQNIPTGEMPTLNPDNRPDDAVNNGSKGVVIESEPQKESRPETTGSDTKMGETGNDAELDENVDTPDAGVVVLDD